MRYLKLTDGGDSNTVEKYIQKRKGLINDYLDKILPPHDDYPPSIHESQRYTLFAGGKRIRSILLISIAEMFGQNIEAAIPPACAVELIHTSLLIIDDLPSMFRVEFRRGKIANHDKFNENIALLSAISLITKSYEILSNPGFNKLSLKKKNRISYEISKVLSSYGILGGQAVDLSTSIDKSNFETLEYLSSQKTGALFIGAARLGIIVGGGTDKDMIYITAFAKNFGLAYQIKDEILNFTGENKDLEKTETKEYKKRTSYISFVGLTESKRIMEELLYNSIKSLSFFGKKAELIKLLAKSIILGEG